MEAETKIETDQVEKLHRLKVIASVEAETLAELESELERYAASRSLLPWRLPCLPI